MRFQSVDQNVASMSSVFCVHAFNAHQGVPTKTWLLHMQQSHNLIGAVEGLNLDGRHDCLPARACHTETGKDVDAALTSEAASWRWKDADAALTARLQAGGGRI